MKSLLLTRDVDGASSEKRKDTDNIILRRAKIRMLAYKGAFDNYCNQYEIAEAKKGFCPNGFEVHHIIPLNCSNSTLEIDNMLVIDKKAHTWLHNNIYSPALAKCEVGQDCKIFLPDYDPKEVLTWEKIQPFVRMFQFEISRMSNKRYS